MPLKTQGVHDLVRAIIATLPLPYTADVIEDVCVEIEGNQEWPRRYDALRHELGRDVVNNWIGRYKKQIVSMNTVRQVPATRSHIIGSYTILS